MTHRPSIYEPFRRLREAGAPFIDQTGFLSAWLASDDAVRVVCRPQGFGKTTMLSAAACLLSRAAPKRVEELFAGCVAWESADVRALAGTLRVCVLDLTAADGAGEGELLASVARAVAVATGVGETPVAEIRPCEAIAHLRAHLSSLACEGGSHALFLVDGFDAPIVSAWRRGFLGAVADELEDLLGVLLEPVAGVRVLMMGEVPLAALTRLGAAPGADDACLGGFFGVTEQAAEDLLAACGHASLTGALFGRFGGYRFDGGETVLSTAAVVAVARTGTLDVPAVAAKGLDEAAHLLRDTGVGFAHEATPLMSGRYLSRTLPGTLEPSLVGVELASTWAYLAATGVVGLSGADGLASGPARTLEWATGEVREGMCERVLAWFVDGGESLGRLARALVSASWGDVERWLAAALFSLGHGGCLGMRERWAHLALGLSGMLGRAWAVRAHTTADGMEVLGLVEATLPWQVGRTTLVCVALVAATGEMARMRSARGAAQGAADEATLALVGAVAGEGRLERAGIALDACGRVCVCPVLEPSS